MPPLPRVALGEHEKMSLSIVCLDARIFMYQNVLVLFLFSAFPQEPTTGDWCVPQPLYIME